MKKNNALGRGIDAIFLENTLDAQEDGGVKTLRINQIEPKAGQPRKNFDNDALSELADSIAAHGVLQPILVRNLIDDRYQIVAGERRWRASKMAGLTEVPVVIIEGDERKIAQIALIENIQREELNPLEEAMAYRSLAEEYRMTQEEIAGQIGKSRSAIANMMRLLDLPKELMGLVSDGTLSAGHARTLLSLRDKEDMILLAEKTAENEWSVRTLEEEVRKYLARKAKEEKDTEEEPKPFEVDYVAELEKRMMRNLGRKVKISAKKGKQSVTIFYEDNEDLEILLSQICGKEFNEEI